MNKPLWTKNYRLMIAGIFISALGGIGLNVAFGLVIFDETQSTLMSALFGAISTLPYIVLPLVIGPLIDRKDPLKTLLANEKILAFIYLGAGLYVHFFGFNYTAYMLIILAISMFAIVSDIASQSIAPQIIDKSNYGRGFAIVSTIYPLCQVMVTPIAIFLYSKFGLESLFFTYAILTVIDIVIESNIDAEFAFIEKDETTEVKEDLKEGFRYLKSDKALLNVLLFFSVVMFSNGYSSLLYPYFSGSSVYTLSDYSLLISISSAGYMVGGLLHYFIKIKDHHRYVIAITVYFVFVTLESLFFFMPFIIMCLIKFVLGIAGMNSANIRSTSVQQRVNPYHRAKVNSFFSIAFSVAGLLGQVLVGSLAEFMDYRVIQIGCQVLYFIAILYFVIPKERGIKELYNYKSETEA